MKKRRELTGNTMYPRTKTIYSRVSTCVCVFVCVWGCLIVQLADCVFVCLCVSLWGQKKMMKGSSVDGRHC